MPFEDLTSRSVERQRTAAVEIARTAPRMIDEGRVAELADAIALIPPSFGEEIRLIVVRVAEKARDIYVLTANEAAHAAKAAGKAFEIGMLKDTPARRLLDALVASVSSTDFIEYERGRSKKPDAYLIFYGLAVVAQGYAAVGDAEGLERTIRTAETVVDPKYKPTSGVQDIRAHIPAQAVPTVRHNRGAVAALAFIKEYGEPYAGDRMIAYAYLDILKNGASELYDADKSLDDLIALAEQYVKAHLANELESRQPGALATTPPRTKYEALLAHLAEARTAWETAQKGKAA